jgi:hypothetical protein
MAGNLYQRYVWLLDLVSRYNGITFDEISNRWQESTLNDSGEPLPKRTLHNHIEAIEQMFNMRIECQRKGGYKYHIADAANGQLSASQKALLEHLRFSNTLMDNKINKYIELSSPIYSLLNTISDAIISRRRIEFHCSEETLEGNIVAIAPYYLKQLDNSWFLFGQLRDGKIAIYQLEEISNLSILPEPFTHPEVGFRAFCDSLNSDDAISFDRDDSAIYYWMQNLENEMDEIYHEETIFTGLL